MQILYCVEYFLYFYSLSMGLEETILCKCQIISWSEVLQKFDVYKLEILPMLFQNLSRDKQF